MADFAIITHKKCKKCGEIKNIELFGIEKRVKDGHQSICKKCHSKRNSINYIKNKTKGERCKICNNKKRYSDGFCGKHHKQYSDYRIIDIDGNTIRKKMKPGIKKGTKMPQRCGANNGFYGRKHTVETRKILSLKLKGHPKLGAYQKGKPLPETTKIKLSKSLKGKMSGKKHWNWKGGTSSEGYSFNFNRELKNLIRKRDNYICKMCKRKEYEIYKENKHKKGFRKNLHVHHIDYNKKNLDPSNLISLCVFCHTKTNFNREKWISFFKRKNYARIFF